MSLRGHACLPERARPHHKYVPRNLLPLASILLTTPLTAHEHTVPAHLRCQYGHTTLLAQARMASASTPAAAPAPSFLDLHRPQLESLGFPAALYARLEAKLVAEIFDAG